MQDLQKNYTEIESKNLKELQQFKSDLEEKEK
jgi:hypothetical protein